MAARLSFSLLSPRDVDAAARPSPASPRRLVQLAGALAVGAVLLLAPERALAQRQSGIQLGYDDETILVSKDIGGDRWAISYNEFDGIVEGNVFPQAGGTPKFVWCEDTLGGDDQNLEFDCFGADPCTVGPCGQDGDAWTPIATVTLPKSFFALPADAVASASVKRPAAPPRRHAKRS